MNFIQCWQAFDNMNVYLCNCIYFNLYRTAVRYQQINLEKCFTRFGTSLLYPKDCDTIFRKSSPDCFPFMWHSSLDHTTPFKMSYARFTLLIPTKASTFLMEFYLIWMKVLSDYSCSKNPLFSVVCFPITVLSGSYHMLFGFSLSY